MTNLIQSMRQEFRALGAQIAEMEIRDENDSRQQRMKIERWRDLKTAIDGCQKIHDEIVSLKMVQMACEDALKKTSSFI